MNKINPPRIERIERLDMLSRVFSQCFFNCTVLFLLYTAPFDTLICCSSLLPFDELLNIQEALLKSISRGRDLDRDDNGRGQMSTTAIPTTIVVR
jgi:hypothetical protein